MKKSIKHLPKRTQHELEVLIELITKYVRGCEMIILFGSYAKGSHVFWDERCEFGRVPTLFQSDLDILVVVRGDTVNPVSAERLLRNKVEERYYKIFDELRPMRSGSRVIRYAPPQFIAENIGNLNRQLSRQQYFYTDIVKEGIKIYDTGNCELTKPCKKLPFDLIKELAETEFNVMFPDGNGFLKVGRYSFNEGDYKIGSFLLHQACERYYKAIEMVFTNYRPKYHELKKLYRRIRGCSEDLRYVFPLNTDFEKRCYDLICRAYIEARYNPEFVVTKEELEYMLERVEVLKGITERICIEKIAFYDSMIEVRSRTGLGG